MTMKFAKTVEIIQRDDIYYIDDNIFVESVSFFIEVIFYS